MSMKQYAGKVKLLTDTPFGYTLTMIGGKWRLIILYWLVEHEAVRYNELQRLIGTITPRTLSTQLKEMEADGLIIRTEYPQIPPKVEYSLSEKGRSLYPIMEAMCEWGEQYQNKEEKTPL
ncbi:MAG: winged helix-turn-helix transcriptional regulator [Christensenellales bacterium]|jgi:DNA-binding HxlR family transcriptional regulator